MRRRVSTLETLQEGQVIIQTRIAVRLIDPLASVVLTLPSEMAMNVGIEFHTPEAYFLQDSRVEKFTLSGWDPSSYDHSGPSFTIPFPPSTLIPSPVALFSPTSTPIIPRTPKFSEAKPEVVLFVGSPGSGKSHFYKTHFQPAGYTHIVCLSLPHSESP